MIPSLLLAAVTIFLPVEAPVRGTEIELGEIATIQGADPAILAQVYGSGPVSGQAPQPAPDGLAHLTLITCSGSYVNGSYDHRLVVYATRSE